MNMQLNMLLTLMSAASLALVACEKPASTTVAEATPTPAPIAPVVDEKAANWKIIEDMRKGIVQSTPTPSPTVIPHLLMGDNKANYKAPTPVTTTKHKTNQPGVIVDNVADADATHIYFGPTNDRSVVRPEEQKFNYDQNSKAYTRGWKDGWNWASKQPSGFSESTAEAEGKRLYGDIDNDPGETAFLGLQAACMLVGDRHEAQAEASLKPALSGDSRMLDQAGSSPYEWTKRYIEAAAGVGDGQLIAPNVTFGPYATSYSGQKCWLNEAAARSRER
jgi:hypothetical protein